MQMKKTILATALFGLFSSNLAIAGTLNGEVEYQNGQYQLNWQSSSPVTVKVNQVDQQNKTSTLVKQSQQTNFNWPADDNHRHYFSISNAEGDEITLATRSLPLQGGRNFRDLGGYQTSDGKTVKWGKLFRSGVLANLTKQDYQFLQELSIKTVVDFRATSEQQNEPTEWQAGEINHLTWDYEMDYQSNGMAGLFSKPDISSAEAEAIMAKLYVGLLQQQTPHYKAMFEQLTANSTPMVIHCTAGKDRTGIGSALLLTALGVDETTVIADYTLTDTYLDPEALMAVGDKELDPKEKAMREMFAQLPKPAIAALMSARTSYIESALAEMRKESGSVINFIHQKLGVNDEQIASLRAAYLQ